MHVPQRWVNAYHNYGMEPIPEEWNWKYGCDDGIPPEWQWKNSFIEPGDLLVHLPGSGTCRNGLIRNYLGKVQEHGARYIVPPSKTAFESEIKRFWAEAAHHEEENQVIFWRRFHVLKELGPKFEQAEREAIVHFLEVANNRLTEHQVQVALQEIKQEKKERKIEALRAEYIARFKGEKSDCTHAV